MQPDRYSHCGWRQGIAWRGGFHFSAWPVGNERCDAPDLSVPHKPTGPGFTVSTGVSSHGGNYSYYKLGYLAGIVDAGTTAFWAGYNCATDINALGSRSAAWGIGAVQSLKDEDLEIYLGYRHYSFLNPSMVPFNDVQALRFGMRYRF